MTHDTNATPRTDAETRYVNNPNGRDHRVVSQDFARQLERELNETKHRFVEHVLTMKKILGTDEAPLFKASDLVRERDALKAEVEELRKDKARIDGLDALIQNENDLDICKRNDGYWATEIFRQQHPDDKPYSTFRQAIDAAMKGQP